MLGLAAISEVILPNWRGKGMLGLLLDTIALAKQGTTRTADKAATVSNFTVKASQGSLKRVAYRLRIPYLSRGWESLVQLWWNLTL